LSAVLGIVGGGQLALYLCEAAQALGFEVAILADGADAPALQRADRPFTAGMDRMAALAQFLASCDVITFDKEAVADDMLTVLMEESQRKGLAIRPAVGTLHLLKDKALQKTWLREQGLPTLPFRIIAGRPDALCSLTQELGSSLVQKSPAVATMDAACRYCSRWHRRSSCGMCPAWWNPFCQTARKYPSSRCGPTQVNYRLIPRSVWNLTRS